MVISDINGVLWSANATEYGLAAGVFTRDISKALHMSDRLLAGTIFVNTYNKTDVAVPFGGYKQSGFGKDLGTFIVCSFGSQLRVSNLYILSEKPQTLRNLQI